MADLDKIYELTIENNANIKHLMSDHVAMKEDIEDNTIRILAVENVGKKTIKEHLISFSKVCAAFIVIGSGFTGMVKVIGMLWQ